MKKKIIFISIVIVVCVCILIIVGIDSKREARTSEDFEIIDTTEICAEALERIYSDSIYEYFLNY